MSCSLYQAGKVAVRRYWTAPRSSVNSGAAFALHWGMTGGALKCPPHGGEENMLFTLALILFVAWMLGLVGVYTIGSIVHVLLVIALVLFLVGIISGRRTVV
jgi:hypothetical protein